MPPEDDLEEIWAAIRPNRNQPLAPEPEVSLADVALLILEARDRVKNNTVSRAILATRIALKILKYKVGDDFDADRLTQQVYDLQKVPPDGLVRTAVNIGASLKNLPTKKSEFTRASILGE
jgi:hypothetical protein